jgi:hypothetical protein
VSINTAAKQGAGEDKDYIEHVLDAIKQLLEVK